MLCCEWPVLYINEFEQLNKKSAASKIELPPEVCAYQLFKNANFPKEKRDLPEPQHLILVMNQ